MEANVYEAISAIESRYHSLGAAPKERLGWRLKLKSVYMHMKLSIEASPLNGLPLLACRADKKTIKKTNYNTANKLAFILTSYSGLPQG